MKIQLIAVGKTAFPYLKQGMEIYLNRLKHYGKFEYLEIPDVKQGKNWTSEQVKQTEGKKILDKVEAGDRLVLLDENGKAYTSRQFAKYFQQWFLSGEKKLVFVIGGAFGFSDEVYARSNGKVSLSKMTFSHQMIRLFALEQIYRAQTILKGESYHND
ncbi:23S rRNA (pseudouridine(1915)-N(3))-methyltransferase RlmH [Halocola ammonii]